MLPRLLIDTSDRMLAMDNLNVSPIEALKIVKDLVINSEEYEKFSEDDKILFENLIDKMTNDASWLKDSCPDEYEGKSVKEISENVSFIKSIFDKVKKQNEDSNKSLYIEKIEKIAQGKIGNLKTENIEKSFTKRNEIRISEGAEKYRSEMMKGGNWTLKTKEENLYTHNLFVEIMGDIVISDIARLHMSQFKEKLQRLPKNFNKMPETRNLRISQIVEEEHDYEVISLRTINKNLTKISSLFNWLCLNGYCNINVASKLMIKSDKKDIDDADPYSLDDLKEIFEKVFSSNNKKIHHTYYYWLPLLGLFTGARINELSQLYIEDVVVDSEIMYLDINKEKDKTLKTKYSKRIVPIHSELIRLGFVDFYNNEKNRGNERLFQSLTRSRDGYGTASSKWYGRFTSVMSKSVKDKSFHSFRHTLIAMLLEKNVPEVLSSAIVGQKHEQITYGRYGSGPSLSMLKETIEKITIRFDENGKITK